jgi:hypothetical protein
MEMTYQQAERLRGKSFGSLLGEQEGGLGTSLRKTLSLKSKARMTGIKEKFDPLNIAKFLTGGSNLAPAMLGKLFGRSKEDIARFSGSKLKDVSGTATKIGSLEGENETLSILLKIYEFMRKSNEDKIAQRQEENNFAEENKLEKDRRHKELIAAITGKPVGVKEKETAEKVQEDSSNSLLTDILSMFGLKDLAKATLKSIGGIASAAVGGLGGFLLGGAAAAGIAYFMYKVLTDESSYEGKDSPLSRALKQAESAGGLAGVKDEEDRIKKLPEYDRTMAELINYEKNYNEGEKLGEMQLAGFAKRGSESARAVEDYKTKRDGKPPTATPGTQTPQTPTPAAGETPTSSPAPSAPMGEPPAVESSSTGQALNVAQSQNLDLNLPQSKSDPSSVVNNTVTSSNKNAQPKVSMPTVRNQEPTFANMILYSTKVV